MKSRRMGIGLVAAVALLVVAQPALAGWLSLMPAFSDANTVPEVAMAPDGTLAAAYTVPTNGNGDGDVQVRIRPPGGDFGLPVTLAPNASDAQVAIGRGGHVAVVWRSGSGRYAAVRPPDGAFGPEHEIAPDGSFAFISDLTLAPDGRVWMVRTILSESDVVTLGPDGSVTSFPLDIDSAVDDTAPPSLALDGAGRVTVVYRHATFVKTGDNSDDPCHFDFEIRVAEGGAGGFADVATIDRETASGTLNGGCRRDGSEPIAPHVVVCPDGEALATYGLDVRTGGNDVETRIVARHRPAGGAWPAAASSAEPIAVQSFGEAGVPAFAGATPLVLLEDRVHRTIALAARGGDGSWPGPQPVTTKLAQQAAIAASPSGSALIVYIDLSTARATGVARAPDGVLSLPTPLSSPLNGWIPLEATLSVAADDDGNGVVAFGEPEHEPWFAPFDGAGPRVSATFPAGGPVGQPLGFAATAVDTWSGPVTLDWSFGDETTASGPTAAHAYEEPGTFTATVTAADLYGRKSTRSATVTIADVTAPRFRGKTSIRPRRVRAGQAAILRFALSEPATVRVTATTRLPGVRHGKRCVAPKRRAPAAVAAAARCKRTLQLALASKRFTLDGTHSLRLSTKHLAPARYTLRLTAQDAAGNRSKAATLTLVVLPRRR